MKKSDLNDFLVSKLNALKLNDQETSDFISYWVPIINKEKSEYIYISFLFNKQVEQLARIDYSTSPDSEIRVFMVYKPVSENYKAEELILPQNKREGFTVVEWGGAELP